MKKIFFPLLGLIIILSSFSCQQHIPTNKKVVVDFIKIFEGKMPNDNKIVG